jgi:hypothetical protein
MKTEASLINHDSQSLIANTHDGHTKPSVSPIYIIDNIMYIGVLHILVTQEYQQTIFVCIAMQTAMN